MAKKTNFRIFVIATCVAIFGILLVINVFLIDVKGIHLLSGTAFSSYTGMSLKSEVISAQRGKILDRNGTVLAEDSTAYDIIVYLSEERPGYADTPSYVSQQDRPEVAERLANVLGCSSDVILSYLQQDLYQTELGYYGRGLSESVKQAIENLNIGGVEFKKSSVRYYPLSSFASYLIGYASKNDSGVMTGQMGLESYLNEQLTGTDGYQKYYQDATGIILPGQQVEYVGAVNGNDVYLTLDTTVQQALEEALSQTMGLTDDISHCWGAVMEVSTGKLLGWGSYPTFNQNDLKIDDYLDYCSMVAYEPGSTMKTFTYAAAIDSGVYENTEYNSAAFYIGYSNGKFVRLSSSKNAIGKVNNYKNKSYGTVTLDEAYTRSLNTGVATIMINGLSADTLASYLDSFGFFKPVDSYGINEVSGTKNMTYPLDQIATTYGQASSVTMLQLLQAYSAIMNGGTMVKPYIVDRIVNPASDEVVYQGQTTVAGQPISAQTSAEMIAKMDTVVNSGLSSSGKQYQISGVRVIGKTGTAECAENGSYASNLTVHSIVLGMPADNPQVIIYMAYMDHQPLKLLFTKQVNSLENAVVKVLNLSDSSSEDTPKEYDTLQLYPDGMPNLANHTVAYVKNKLSDLEITLLTLGDGPTVIKQYPQSGTALVSGQRVMVLTSNNNIKMPDMTGWSRKEVTAFWSLTGISITMNGYGYVSEQNIAADTVLSADSQIEVTLK